ncbi:MAG: hypothetical protein K1Y02_26590 [Candidatus Hydrogenedentes bacterium]|nr:hypothetical protein [Candidatus Hydrogenedentota bacterium]
MNDHNSELLRILYDQKEECLGVIEVAKGLLDKLECQIAIVKANSSSEPEIMPVQFDKSKMH